jgi:predicted ester cyclase
MVRSHASKIRAANSALLAKGDVDAVAEFFAADYVAHLTDQDLTGGPGAIRGFLLEIRRAFPDLRVEVEILVGAKDRVAWQRTLRATHRGDFKGFPAAGRPIVWRDMATRGSGRSPTAPGARRQVARHLTWPRHAIGRRPSIG